MLAAVALVFAAACGGGDDATGPDPTQQPQDTPVATPVQTLDVEPEPGTEGIEFFGHSFVCDPFGRVIAEVGTDPAVLVAEVDPAEVEDTRRNWPFLRDRRIDAYGPILNRWLS